MNIAFIVTSYWAYGELSIALSFAKRIKKYGYNPYFFIPPSHKKILEKERLPYTLLIPKSAAINKILIHDYDLKYKPKMVILSDFINYNFCEKHYGLTVSDLKIFEGRLGTFDNFDWGLCNRAMDTYGFKSRTTSEIDLDSFGVKFCPCPIVNSENKSSNEKNKYYFSLVDNYLDYNTENKRKLREKLNLPLDVPIILNTSASWQNTYKNYEHVVNFVNVVEELYFKILLESVGDGLLVNVGPNDYVKSLKDNNKILCLDKLLPEEFDEYALACDVFITRNITSTTLWKLALSGIPSVLIKNTLEYNKKNNNLSDKYDDLEICYPYLMFPVGWSKFLKPVMNNNPYNDLIVQTEVFKVEESVNIIQRIIKDQLFRNKLLNKSKRIQKLLDELDTPSDILNKILISQ